MSIKKMFKAKDFLSWLLIFSIVAVSLSACNAPTPDQKATKTDRADHSLAYPDLNNSEDKKMQKIREIYFAGGCFWGVEAYFQKVTGVEATQVGYINGQTTDTDYSKIAKTGHAEAVKLSFDSNLVHPAELIYHLFRIIDPTSLNQQGNDIGSQYRTGIYAQDQDLLDLAQAMLDHLQTKYDQTIRVEVEKLDNFIPAEDYHQDYLVKNPGGYCHINLATASQPLIADLDYPRRENQDQMLKAEDPKAYEIMREAATEAPFSSDLNGKQDKGIYVDRLSGEPLFSSDQKFDAGCGWPSFTRPILTQSITYHQDLSHGRTRTETKSLDSEAHLGHVFSDGPTNLGGLRFCINGACLEFIPLDQMIDRGYGDFIFFVQK